MKRLILPVLALLMMTAAPSSGAAAEPCFGQDSSGEGRLEKPCRTPRCYRDLNGRGEVIKWVKTEHQCRHQSNGQSWGYPGLAVNIYRDIYPR